MIIPSETPLAKDVDFERLSHYEICGGSIKNAVYRAAANAALRDIGKFAILSSMVIVLPYYITFMILGKRFVYMADLDEACNEELTKTAQKLNSDASTIYN